MWTYLTKRRVWTSYSFSGYMWSPPVGLPLPTYSRILISSPYLPASIHQCIIHQPIRETHIQKGISNHVNCNIIMFRCFPVTRHRMVHKRDNSLHLHWILIWCGNIDTNTYCCCNQYFNVYYVKWKNQVQQKNRLYKCGNSVHLQKMN